MKKPIILISFLILGFAQNVNAQETDTSTVYKLFQVQQKAEFPGGDTALDKFIINNMVIPDSAYELAGSGTILVSFVIEKDGSLSGINISSIRKIGFGVEEAAIDVIKKMPKWKPAIYGDKPCRMAFMKPIRLKFN